MSEFHFKKYGGTASYFFLMKRGSLNLIKVKIMDLNPSW